MALVTVQRSPTPESGASFVDQLQISSSKCDESLSDQSFSSDHDVTNVGHTACFSPVSNKIFERHGWFSCITRSRYFAVKGAAVILSSPKSANARADEQTSSRQMKDELALAEIMNHSAEGAEVDQGEHVKQCASVKPQANANAGEIQQHLQAMLHLLRPQDTLKMAVRLESMLGTHTRYMAIVCASADENAAARNCEGAAQSPCEEAAIIGIDYVSPKKTTIGLVLPIWANTIIGLDGDGGITVESQSVCASSHGCEQHVNSIHAANPSTSSQSASVSGVVISQSAHSLKPVSVQAMWSAYQALHREHGKARRGNYFPGGGTHAWLKFYETSVNSPESFRSEWHCDTLPLSLQSGLNTNANCEIGDFAADGIGRFKVVSPERAKVERAIRGRLKEIMQTVDLDEVTSKDIRGRLESRMDRSLRDYKPFIDREMLVILGQMDRPSRIFDYLYLGTEWNASNWDELNANGVRYILNVTKEVDNFFPGLFNYMKIRVSDEESAELLKHWDLTYKFVNQARDSGGAVLVHCKKGISRSSSTVIAYAMKEFGWSVDDALAYVKSKRNIITPNKGFVRQLRTYNGILEASRNRNSALFNNPIKIGLVPDRDSLVHSASVAGPMQRVHSNGITPVLSTSQIHCKRVTVTKRGNPPGETGNFVEKSIESMSNYSAESRGMAHNFPGRLLVASENILKSLPPQSDAPNGGEHMTSLELPGWDDSAPVQNTRSSRRQSSPSPSDTRDLPSISVRLPAVNKALQRRESGKVDAADDTLKSMQNMLVRTKRHSAGSAGAGSSTSGASSLMESDSSLDMSASDDEHKPGNTFGANVRCRSQQRGHSVSFSAHFAHHNPRPQQNSTAAQNRQRHRSHQKSDGKNAAGKHGSKNSVKSAAADSAVADLGANAEHESLIRTQSSNSMHQRGSFHYCQPCHMHKPSACKQAARGAPNIRAAATSKEACCGCCRRRPSSMTRLAEEGRAGVIVDNNRFTDFTPVPGQVKRTAVTYEMRHSRSDKSGAPQKSSDSDSSGSGTKASRGVTKKVNAGRKFFDRFFPPKKQADGGEKQPTTGSKWYHDVRKRKPVDGTNEKCTPPSAAASHSIFYHHYQPTPLLAAVQKATGSISQRQPANARTVDFQLLTNPGERRTFAGASASNFDASTDENPDDVTTLGCCRSEENLVRSLVGVFERSYDATHESLEPSLAMQQMAETSRSAAASIDTTVRFTLGDSSQNNTPVKCNATGEGESIVRANRALTFE